MLNKEQLQASEINDSRVLVLAGPEQVKPQHWLSL